jgi:hypothetical protein
MKISGSLLLALYLVSPWVSSEIFKCADGKGNDKYQNFPCSIDSIGSKATVAPPKEEPGTRTDDKGSGQAQATGSAQYARQVAASAVAPASGQKQPEPGMKMNDVRATWGVPNSTDVHEGAEIWYYDVPSGNVLGVRFDRTGMVQRVGEVPKVVDSND